MNHYFENKYVKFYTKLKQKLKLSKVELIFALVILIGGYVYYFLKAKASPDFEVFYRAGERYLAGEPLYRLTDGHYQFKYLPASAAFFSVFASLPYQVARFVWYSLILISTITFLLSWKRYFNLSNLGLLAVCLVVGRFIELEWKLGQVNLILLVILTYAYFFQKRNKWGVFSVLVVLGACIKPNLLPFLFFPLLAQQYKWFLINCALFIVGLLLPLFNYGLNDTIMLYDSLGARLTDSTSYLLPLSASVMGFFAKHFSLSMVNLLTIIVLCFLVVLYFLVLTNYKFYTKKYLVLHSYIAALGLVPLCFPQSWDYNYLYFLPIIMFVVKQYQYLPQILSIVFIVLCILSGGAIYDLITPKYFWAYQNIGLVTPVYVALFILYYYLTTKTLNIDNPNI